MNKQDFSSLNKNEQIELMVFEIVRQGNNLKIINECQEMGLNAFWALKNIVILESQEQLLKELFKVKTAFKNKSIKELPEFIKLFEMEARF